MRLVKAGKPARALTRLKPGQELEIFLNDVGSVDRLVYYKDVASEIHVDKTNDGYQSRQVDTPLERRVASAAGIIQSSLFVAGQEAGLKDKVIMQMVDIFSWDVDFALDIRVGDRFNVIYEEFYKDGKKVRDGIILAAEFVNRGRSTQAVRYENPNGQVAYYSPQVTACAKPSCVRR